MRDSKVSLPRAQALHPKIKSQVIMAIDAIEMTLLPKNVAIRIVEALRTFEYQNGLYAQGRTKPGKKVTNAKGGESIHNYGLAWDFALLYDLDNNGTYEELSWDTLKDFDKDGQADWMEVVNYFKDLAYTWGGDFKSIVDSPHLEKTFGYDWRQLKAKYDKADFIPGTKYVKL